MRPDAEFPLQAAYELVTGVQVPLWLGSRSPAIRSPAGVRPRSRTKKFMLGRGADFAAADVDDEDSAGADKDLLDLLGLQRGGRVKLGPREQQSVRQDTTL